MLSKRGNILPIILVILMTLILLHPPLTITAVEEKLPEPVDPIIITTFSETLYLQVGIFSSKKNAENLREKLEQNGMAVEVETFLNRKGDLLRKVLVGPFASDDEVQREREIVRELTSLSPLIIRREPKSTPAQVSKPEVPENEKMEISEKSDFLILEKPEPKIAETPISAVPKKQEPIIPKEPERTVAGAKKPKTSEKPKPSTSVEPKPEISETPKQMAPQEQKPKTPEKPKPEVPVKGKTGVSGKPRPKIPKNDKAKISLDFTDVDISVLIKFVSELTGKNFIYDEKVRGSITIVSPKKITVDEMYQVFLSVLQVKGFTTVEQGNIVKIIPSREAKQEGLKTYTRKDVKATGEFITQLIPLNYIDAKDAAPLLTPLISPEGLLTFYAPSNTLIIIDRGTNISRIVEILQELDIDTAAQNIKLFQLKNASSDEVSNILAQIFPTTGGAVTAKPPAARRPIKGRRQVTTPGAIVGAKFISDTRTNSIIAIAPSDLMADIEETIGKLDIPAPETVGKINVYYLENADSEELATVLNNLISGAGAGGRAPQPGQPSTIKGIITPEFEGPIKITADKATNSLLVIASPGDYLTLVEVIKKLDIKRRQVYVEAIIMEVDIDNAKDVGIEYRAAFEPTDSSAAILGSNFDFTGNINDLLVALAAGNPLLLSGQGLTAGVIGGTVILPDGTEIPSITAILRAAQVSTNVNVLATPHLLTTDNEEAEIIVGENVPFITSQARDTTNLDNIINTVEREDVGITLKINPQIHESDFVKLDIFQKTEAIKEGTTLLETTTVGPTTTKRSTKTNVIVKSGQTIVLGGLMEERRTRRISKIPILGDIPLLGALFRFESDNSQKKNLLIFLTPKIIKDTSELQGITLRLKESMKDYIDKNTEKADGINVEEYNKVLDPFYIETDGP